MQIRYPKNLSESGLNTVQLYTDVCSLGLYRFQGILTEQMFKSKWENVERIFKEHGITVPKFSNGKFAMNIAHQFINSLRCRYDTGDSCCYYYIPKSIKCYGTNLSLYKVIKLIEYGNDIISPMHWVGHSVMLFYDYILGGEDRKA